METLTFTKEGRLKFIEEALNHGVPMQVSPALACSAAHPKYCLQRVPRVWISLSSQFNEWTIHNPLCEIHAKEAASLYGIELPAEGNVSIPPFKDSDELEQFAEGATYEGIAIQILPGLACSAAHPEECLRRVTRIQLFHNEESYLWAVRAPLCSVHAKEAVSIYDPHKFDQTKKEQGQ